MNTDRGRLGAWPDCPLAKAEAAREPTGDLQCTCLNSLDHKSSVTMYEYQAGPELPLWLCLAGAATVAILLALLIIKLVGGVS